MPQMRDTFTVVMKRMYQDEVIEVIILRCTKLPLLFAGTEAPVKTLDMAYILIVTSFEALNQNVTLIFRKGQRALCSGPANIFSNTFNANYVYSGTVYGCP
ncbi:TPA: hypothetical protein ACKFHL_003406 [Klebsiella pneumoniae]|uniref:hypothetical protein n=1 Tax=Enterobacteriaceae TaxID=543 RepID=UPI001FD6B1CA|nr:MULTISPECIES: hypothetical protein [Enterobacteriaceae]HCL5535273.1 hypothetical protein [Citrobacter werkmanii]EKU5884056.1 hypothetical protein [Klebsiella pneumoniae]EKV7209384.1 hypothetical protein [Klebsiella pneumoniae]MDM2940614.1 hypothetical protein [Citrobacter sp. Cy082]MEA8736973.1 hypothetical protein [Klebsiella pneumoniae]